MAEPRTVGLAPEFRERGRRFLGLGNSSFPVSSQLALRVKLGSFGRKISGSPPTQPCGAGKSREREHDRLPGIPAHSQPTSGNVAGPTHHPPPDGPFAARLRGPAPSSPGAPPISGPTRHPSSRNLSVAAAASAQTYQRVMYFRFRGKSVQARGRRKQ